MSLCVRRLGDVLYVLIPLITFVTFNLVRCLQVSSPTSLESFASCYYNNDNEERTCELLMLHIRTHIHRKCGRTYTRTHYVNSCYVKSWLEAMPQAFYFTNTRTLSYIYTLTHTKGRQLVVWSVIVAVVRKFSLT